MQNSIFSHPQFWRALEVSGSIGADRGMQQHVHSTAQGKLICFSKNHSYGEYIFDWSWANAYAERGLAYYPKLLSMVPFTPATHSHFWGPNSEWPELLRQHELLLPTHSSSHFLFTTPEEQAFLGTQDYILRDSFQYHFFNEGDASFDAFLGRLKAKKAKNIRQERNFVGLQIERLTGGQLSSDHANEMYEFYLSTLSDKQAIPYLTREFFQLMFTTMPNNVLYVRARHNERTIAGALFFYDSQRLYGRYWGAHQQVENLHFELCYYQGIDFCLEKKLAVFEAGAQGEHKISRGFRPVLTTSAHKIRHAGFANAIREYVETEKKQVSEAMKELTKLLPFKSNGDQ